MGKQEAPVQLFYDFDLERRVPANHTLREINLLLDGDSLRDASRPFYRHLGCPSIDLKLNIRMLMIGYVMGIRFERRLCDEDHLNLVYRWFCRLGLEGQVRDYSSFPQCRHGKFRESELPPRVFEATVERCLKEDLVSGEDFGVDPSLTPQMPTRSGQSPPQTEARRRRVRCNIEEIGISHIAHGHVGVGLKCEDPMNFGMNAGATR